LCGFQSINGRRGPSVSIGMTEAPQTKQETSAGGALSVNATPTRCQRPLATAGDQTCRSGPCQSITFWRAAQAERPERGLLWAAAGLTRESAGWTH